MNAMVQCTLVMKDVLWRPGQSMGLYTRQQRGEFCSSHFRLAKTKPKAQGSHLESVCIHCPQDTWVGGANQALGDKTHYWNQEEESQTWNKCQSVALGSKSPRWGVLHGCHKAVLQGRNCVCSFLQKSLIPESQVSEKGCVNGQGLYLSPYVLRS